MRLFIIMTIFANKNIMSLFKNCIHCNTPFTGRANKIYCSASCKSQANNSAELVLRKDSRFFAKVMERNERIFVAFMAHRASASKYVLKSELKQFGFNNHGPFVVYNGRYVVGNYYLKEERGACYEVEKRSTFNDPFIIADVFDRYKSL